MNDLRKEFDIKTRKQEELRDRFLPGNFQTQLKMVTLQAEEESEQVAEKFLNGKIDIDEFKKQFMDVRTVRNRWQRCIAIAASVSIFIVSA